MIISFIILVIVKKINKKIFNKTSNNLFFCLVRTFFLNICINFGLDPKKIKYVIDNDILKQKKRLYGTSLQVRSPKILSSYENPLVILKVGIYKNEIKKDILQI